MKTSTINTNGNFVRILMFATGNSLSYYKRSNWNICELMRHTIWAAIALLMKTFVVVFLLVGISLQMGHGISEEFNLFAVQHWYSYVAITLMGFIVLVAIVAAVIGCMCLMAYTHMAWSSWRVRRKSIAETTEPNPFMLMYKSLKEKTCFKVEFK